MQETAEQVTSEHPALLTLRNDGQSSGSVWRLKLERPVGTMPVVVLDVDTKDLLQMTAPNDQQPIQALGVSGQQTRAQRPARPAAASFAAAGREVAVKYEGWGFNATDKLVPEQRRQQDYRALRERAERISDGD